MQPLRPIPGLATLKDKSGGFFGSKSKIKYFDFDFDMQIKGKRTFTNYKESSIRGNYNKERWIDARLRRENQWTTNTQMSCYFVLEMLKEDDEE